MFPPPSRLYEHVSVFCFVWVRCYAFLCIHGFFSVFPLVSFCVAQFGLRLNRFFIDLVGLHVSRISRTQDCSSRCFRNIFRPPTLALLTNFLYHLTRQGFLHWLSASDPLFSARDTIATSQSCTLLCTLRLLAIVRLPVRRMMNTHGQPLSCPTAQRFPTCLYSPQASRTFFEKIFWVLICYCYHHYCFYLFIFKGLSTFYLLHYTAAGFSLFCFATFVKIVVRVCVCSVTMGGRVCLSSILSRERCVSFIFICCIISWTRAPFVMPTHRRQHPVIFYFNLRAILISCGFIWSTFLSGLGLPCRILIILVFSIISTRSKVVMHAPSSVWTYIIRKVHSPSRTHVLLRRSISPFLFVISGLTFLWFAWCWQPYYDLQTRLTSNQSLLDNFYTAKPQVFSQVSLLCTVYHLLSKTPFLVFDLSSRFCSSPSVFIRLLLCSLHSSSVPSFLRAFVLRPILITDTFTNIYDINYHYYHYLRTSE